jgi:hypothetical protein
MSDLKPRDLAQELNQNNKQEKVPATIANVTTAGKTSSSQAQGKGDQEETTTVQ